MQPINQDSLRELRQGCDQEVQIDRRDNAAQHSPPRYDQMQHQQRHQQVTIFRLATADCVPNCIAMVCHKQSNAHVKQAHKSQNIAAVLSPVQGSTDTALAP